MSSFYLMSSASVSVLMLGQLGEIQFGRFELRRLTAASRQGSRWWWLRDSSAANVLIFYITETLGIHYY